MKKVIVLIICCFVYKGVIAQNTLGLLSYEPSKAFDGYNLFFPHFQSNVYLIDNCGEIVHMWEDDPGFFPGNMVYLLENGNLVKAKRLANSAADPIFAGGAGAMVEIRDWDNQLLWTFELNDSISRLHHDIAPMPNGNILMLAWENKSMEEVV